MLEDPMPKKAPAPAKKSRASKEVAVPPPANSRRKLSRRHIHTGIMLPADIRKELFRIGDEHFYGNMSHGARIVLEYGIERFKLEHEEAAAAQPPQGPANG